MATHLSPVPEAPPQPAADGPSDEELLQSLIAGSSEAVAVLYDRHATAVYRSALRVTSDIGAASDVVQETFLVLWNRAEQFDPSRGALASWLITIARNRAIDRVRFASRHDRAVPFSAFGEDESGADDRPIAEWVTATGTLVGSADPEPAPEAAYAERERRACLELAIGSLGPLEREVIRLAYDAGLTQVEIAERLDWPLGTVKTRTRRALGQLRRRLEDPELGPCAGVAFGA